MSRAFSETSRNTPALGTLTDSKTKYESGENKATYTAYTRRKEVPDSYIKLGRVRDFQTENAK